MNMKAILSFVIIALMLFSCLANINATQSLHTITVHARTQDNDGDGYVRFFNDKGKVYHEEFIRKGETRTYDIVSAKRVDFRSVNRHNEYNADVRKLDLFNEHYRDNLADVYVDVNFYSKSCYYNDFRIDKWTVRGDGWYYAPMKLIYKEVEYQSDDFWRGYI